MKYCIILFIEGAGDIFELLPKWMVLEKFRDRLREVQDLLLIIYTTKKVMNFWAADVE